MKFLNKNHSFFLFLLTLVITHSIASYSQKVDLDRFYVPTEHQKLPKVIVPKEQRTYGVSVKVGSALNSYTNENEIYDRISIASWQKVESSSPTVGISFMLDDFIFRGSEMKNKTTEEKDKDGKVISRRTTYYVVATYAARGRATYSGPAPVEEIKKVEEKKASNPFLAGVETKTSTESGLQVNFNNDYTYTSEEYSSSRDAVDKFRIRANA
jgi:hypothetical protein